jgi:hypothetical protein
MVVLAVQRQRMLAFTWNAPPSLQSVRRQMPHAVVRLVETEKGETSATLCHDGWGEGGEWDAASQYFARAWSEVVLPRLRRRSERGPIDWSRPPALSTSCDEAA